MRTTLVFIFCFCIISMRVCWADVVTEPCDSPVSYKLTLEAAPEGDDTRLSFGFTNCVIKCNYGKCGSPEPESKSADPGEGNKKFDITAKKNVSVTLMINTVKKHEEKTISIPDGVSAITCKKMTLAANSSEPNYSVCVDEDQTKVCMVCELK